MTYKVTAFNIEAQEHTLIGEYATLFEAHCAIEEAEEEDMTYGEYELYDYYINGKRAA